MELFTFNSFLKPAIMRAIMSKFERATVMAKDDSITSGTIWSAVCLMPTRPMATDL